tara:strand:+ start:141 stop:494 length:354 start_codon:yes stop_codon:yes gene_type:complete
MGGLRDCPLSGRIEVELNVRNEGAMRTAIVIVYRTQNLSAERLFEARRTKTGALLGVLRNCTKFKIFEQQQHAASGGIPPAPPFTLIFIELFPRKAGGSHNRSPIARALGALFLAHL